ncbi:MAG: DNA/RNA nuclease SfsA [Pelagimonas sp.]|uniref:DNA/RNA nuclease SfsA n=1 Tax=Pelagimonas sp. TaxID=2073170 RepID=UPI003D6BD9E8
MEFTEPLIPATLLRRYKRFLADCRLDDGREITAHVANPGSMLGMKDPGLRVWLEPNDDPKRKLKFAWRLIEQQDGHFIGVDTGVPNKMLKAALMAGQVPGLDGYDLVRPEVKYGENSRIDFLLTGSARPDCYVEVKSVTLSRQPALAEFPDSVTARGAKHLAELSNMAQAGHRAVMLYLVQRTDCTALTLAADIDPKYAAAFGDAMAHGVEVLSFDCKLSPGGVGLGTSVPFHAPA